MPTPKEGRVTRRLVVVLGSERSVEPIPHQVFSNEVRVDAAELAADEAVSELPPQILEGLQAGAEILCMIPHAIGDVVHLPIEIGRDGGIILYDDHARPIVAEALPQVIGVLVDVEREQVELLRDAELLE